jgi:beta-1,4-N-acetylglucosaminyltransferase
MIFLTVGTQIPFDRLVKVVDEAIDRGVIKEQIYAQIGESLYEPHNFKSVKFLNKQEFDDSVSRCSCIISHAGMGSITLALDNNKPMLVMARLKKFGEAVNDHQVALARRFEKYGCLLLVNNSEEFAEKFKQLKVFVPQKRQTKPQSVAGRITQFLETCNT